MQSSSLWHRLIQPLRYRPPSTEPRELWEELESDRGRIIGSPALRRLQLKTQVHPLEKNAAVRSRLTHSLEVEQTGRFIALKVIRLLGNTDFAVPEELKGPFVSIVEMACLLHDLGNPPFGHFGEASLMKWLKTEVPRLYEPFRRRGKEPGMMEADLMEFDGNAHTQRIIITLHRLNLTYPQILATQKYIRSAGASTQGPFRRKAGWFQTEEPVIVAAREKLGIPNHARYPLAFIMEAADDISYCVSDLEDGMDKNMITVHETRRLLEETWQDLGRHLKPEEQGFLDRFLTLLQRQGNVPSFVRFRTALQHSLCEFAARRFVDCLPRILSGEMLEPLIAAPAPEHTALSTLLKVARNHIFAHRDVETLELRGYSVVHGLLNLYRPLLTLKKADMEDILKGKDRGFPIEARLLRRLPNRYVQIYREQVDAAEERRELGLRIRLVVDFLAGMTDDFAQSEFQALSGI